MDSAIGSNSRDRAFRRRLIDQPLIVALLVGSLFAAVMSVPLQAAAITRQFLVQPANDPAFFRGGGLAGSWQYHVSGSLTLTFDREARTALIAADNTQREFATGATVPTWPANAGGLKHEYMLHVFQNLGTAGRWIDDSTIRFEQCAVLPEDIDTHDMLPVDCAAIGVDLSGSDLVNPLFGFNFVADLHLVGDLIEFRGRSGMPNVLDGVNSSLEFSAIAVTVPEAICGLELVIGVLLYACRQSHGVRSIS